MRSKESIVKEYFQEKFPHKKFLSVLVHKDFGGYFKIFYTDEDEIKEDSVNVSYLDFITWLFNEYITNDKIYINYN